VAENTLAYVIRDGFPVTQYHSLIIPKRHTLDYFGLTQAELNAINSLIHEQRALLDKQDKTIEGYNIGMNCGETAGQTVFHCHVHLMPRRTGDILDPRGGVRNILLDKSGYLNKTIDVVAGVIKKNGKFLIARRLKEKSLGGYWEYPGGKVETGETDEISLKRELNEEFGILVDIKYHLLNSFFIYEKINVNLKAYLVEHIAGEFTLKDHDAIEWITVKEFGNYQFAPADIPVNEYIIRHDI
jgi:mutator protein MutT